MLIFHFRVQPWSQVITICDGLCGNNLNKPYLYLNFNNRNQLTYVCLGIYSSNRCIKCLVRACNDLASKKYIARWHYDSKS